MKKSFLGYYLSLLGGYPQDKIIGLGEPYPGYVYQVWGLGGLTLKTKI